MPFEKREYQPIDSSIISFKPNELKADIINKDYWLFSGEITLYCWKQIQQLFIKLLKQLKKPTGEKISAIIIFHELKSAHLISFRILDFDKKSKKKIELKKLIKEKYDSELAKTIEGYYTSLIDLRHEGYLPYSKAIKVLEKLKKKKTKPILTCKKIF